MVVKDIIKRNARRYPNKTAAIVEDKSCTFRELNNRSNSMTNALLDMGIAKGDRVAVLLDNCLSHAEIYCAIAKGGMVVVPLNASLSKQDLAYIINNTDTNTLLLGENYTDLIDSIREDIRGVRNLIAIGASSDEMRRYEELVSQYPPEEPEIEVDEQDMYAMGFSSGTTGLPKGIISSNKRYIATMLDAIFISHLALDSVVLIPVPLAWMSTIMFAGFYCGCTTVIAREFNPKTILQTIEKEKVTTSVMPPFYITSFLEYPGLREYNLSSLECIVLIGGSMPAEVLKRATEVFGNIFTQTYGNLEGGWLTFLSPEEMILEGPPEKVKRLQSCGRRGKGAISAEVRVVNESDNDILPGQVGEVIAGGDNIIKEYWKLPQATAETFRGGYLYTGDIATVDEEGYIYLVGREKDVINSGAESVYPNEVEEVLYRHPAILEATVIGVPDVKLGEAVTAVVVLREEKRATEEEIIGFCRQYLVGFAIPGSVEFIDRLPRNASGKILKRELRERYSKA